MFLIRQLGQLLFLLSSFSNPLLGYQTDASVSNPGLRIPVYAGVGGS